MLMNHVVVGKTVNVPGSSGKGLIITNTGDSTVRVRTKVLKPAPDQLRPGAKALPDLSWVSIAPEYQDVLPHQQGVFHITLNVPASISDDRYQFMVWSRGESLDDGGLLISAGLLSRVRIQTVHE
jgi:hypothetical protein